MALLANRRPQDAEQHADLFAVSNLASQGQPVLQIGFRLHKISTIGGYRAKRFEHAAGTCMIFKSPREHQSFLQIGFGLRVFAALPCQPAKIVEQGADALVVAGLAGEREALLVCGPGLIDRKSTRLNSSHVAISYAV